MDDFATLPGGIYVGGSGSNLIDADHDMPGSFDNLILTFGGKDTVLAGLGDDTVSLGEGNDLAFGGGGSDRLFGDEGNDAMDGGTGNDLLDGDKGNDLLSGGAGDDALGGGRGNDLLAGGQGSDMLVGGEGHDILAGGAGQDSFVFESGFGKDVVLDFQPGTDVLSIEAHINGLAISTAADLARHVSGDAISSTITLGSDTIKLVGVSKADLLGHLDQYVKIV
jgi:Ca2+-binding RTX toxin-like protein